MNIKVAFSLILLNLTVISVSYAYEIIDTDNDTYRNMVPAHMINHWGFEVKDEIQPSAEDFGDPSLMIPMFPVYKSKFGSKKFIGVKIPAEYTSELGIARSNQSNSSRIIINTVNPLGNTPRGNEKFQDIARQFREFEVEPGVHLVPHVYNGAVYGVRSDYQVSYSNSTSVGFSLSFGGSSNRVNFGQVESWGVSANLGFSAANIGEVSGLNFGDSINDLFAGIDMGLNADKSMDAVSMAMKFTPYIQSHIREQYKDPQDAYLRSGDIFTAVRYMNRDWENEMNISSEFVERDIFTREFKRARRSLVRNLDEEIEWKSKIAASVNHSKVYDDREANQLIQNVCDHVSKIFAMPEEIWPKCSVSATIIPNAWAYPSGSLFFAAGLIGILSDLDSLIFIVGHEIAHVYGRHTSKMMPKYDAFMYFANTLGIAANAFTLSAGAGQLGKVTFGNWFWKSPVASVATGYTANYVMRVAAAGVMSFGRANEAQSDRFGHQAALVAGAHPEGLEKGWRDFQEYFTTYIPVEKGFWEKLLASHPSSESRLRKIQRRNEKYEKYRGDFSSNRLDQSFYDSYLELHHTFKPLTHLYGEHLRSKILAAEQRRESLSMSDQYLLHSMFSASAQCALHTFGFHEE